jgi:hypothetical protein
MHRHRMSVLWTLVVYTFKVVSCCLRYLAREAPVCDTLITPTPSPTNRRRNEAVGLGSVSELTCTVAAPTAHGSVA